MTTATHQEPRVTAWIREPAPYSARAAVEDVLDRLDDLDADDAIAGVDVRCWGARVRPSGRDPTGATDALAEFSAWAADEGVDLAPAVEERTLESSLVDRDEPRDVVVLPILCLAVYDPSGGLRAVFPHRADDEVRTVSDGLDQVASGAFDDRGSGGEPADPPAASVPSRPGPTRPPQ